MFKIFLFCILAYSNFALAQNLKIFVALNPAGDFVAESDQVTGEAVENSDGSIQASGIKVPVKSLKTGISLRDEHMINKYLEASKFPEVVLKVAKGKAGKGEAILIVKGKQAKVSGNYQKGNDKLNASFKVKLSDFGIENINYKGIGVDDDAKIEVTVPLNKKISRSEPAVNPKPAPAKK